MKLKGDLILREVANTWVVLPLSKELLDFNGMLTLNETGAYLWKALQKGENPVDALVAEYDVSREQATTDVEEFIDSIRKAGCLEE